jgi:hypothetical protein
MTLQIQNIYYDHGQESWVYERGVYSIDSVTKRIHVHDGVTPNGIGTPIMADLSQFATKNLSNVTQEDITNMLTNFGALNMNTSSPITTVQRDNVYGKLYMTPLQSTASVPASNFLSMNSTTRQISARNTSEVPTFFPSIDTSQTSYARAVNVQYTASRHCCVLISCAGVNNWEIGNFFIDGVQVFHFGALADRAVNVNMVQQFFVASGSVYKATGAITGITEYGVKKLSF